MDTPKWNRSRIAAQAPNARVPKGAGRALSPPRQWTTEEGWLAGLGPSVRLAASAPYREGDFRHMGAGPTFRGWTVEREAAMAEKRKGGAGQRKRVVVRRRATEGDAGRLAVRRETAAYRSAAMEEHSAQVRERIEAALAEGRRMRQDIELRIEQRLSEEDQGTAGQLLSRLRAESRLHEVKPPVPEARERTGDKGRPKGSSR